MPSIASLSKIATHFFARRILALLIALFTTSICHAGFVAAASKPNIVVIMTDDQEESDLLSMPYTKQYLEDRGTRFVNSFVSTPVCASSRASFLSGQYAHNHEVLTTGQLSYKRFKPREQQTLPFWLQQAGYNTAMIGKYINGYASTDPVPRGWGEWFVQITSEKRGHKYYNYTVNHNGSVIEYTGRSKYSTDVLAAQAKSFIRSSRDKPFFLVIAPIAKHKHRDNAPVPPPRYLGLYSSWELPKSSNFNESDVSDKPLHIRKLPLFAEMQAAVLHQNHVRAQESLRGVDDLVMGVVQTLEQQGISDNTYIIFTSDNGFTNGAHRVVIGKGVLYESSIRVPLMMAGPTVPRNKIRRHLVQNIDLAPTILDWAGVLPLHQNLLDGRSLTSILNSDASAWRSSLLISRLDHSQSENAFFAVRSAIDIYARYGNLDLEYYHFRSDPDQLNNSIRKTRYQDRVTLLKNNMEKLIGCRASQCWID